MQINIDDSINVYTADQDYDGPEGTLLKGERFRVVDFYKKHNLALVSNLDTDDYMTIRVDREFNVVSD